MPATRSPTGGTTLRWLGDVIPVPLPVRPEVVSPGDVLIAAGLGEFVLLGMRPRRRPSSPVRRNADCRSVALTDEEILMAKKKRKRRARAKSKANHGKRPNC